MKVEEFIRFNELTIEKIYLYSEDRIKGVVQEGICKDALTKHGIPRSVSPFIDFLNEEKGGFDRLSSYVKMHLIKGFELPQKEILKEAIIFGFGSNGANYLVVDSDGRVMSVDHEDWSLLYVNKDLETFFEIILKFNLMLEEYNVSNPDGDFFEDELPNIVDEFMDFIETIDEDAIYNDAFWDMTLEECLDY